MNKKIKNLYLHVGMQKTATTSIQETFYKNLDLFEKEGYFYYSKEINHGIFLNSIFNEKPEKTYDHARNAMKREECLKYNDAFKNSIEEEIDRTSCENVVFSGENISNMKKTNIENMLNFFKELMPEANVKIIISTRRNFSFLVSMYQEMIKSGPGKERDFNEFFNPTEPVDIFRHRIEKFIELVGSENIDIYKFEDAVKHEYGPVGYFLSKIGFSDISKLKIVKTNESVSDKSIEVLRFIQDNLPLMNNYKLNNGRFAFDTNPLLEISGEKYYFPKEVQEKYNELGKEDEIWLKENTSIDYLENVKFNEPKVMIFDEIYEKEMEGCLQRLSPVIYKIIYYYFEEKIKDEKLDLESKKTFEKLIKFSKEYFGKEVINKDLKDIINVHKRTQRYKKTIDDFIQDCIIQNEINEDNYYKEVNYYKELADFCEKSDQIEAAVYFIEVADKIRSNNGMIEQKHREYTEILNKKKEKYYKELKTILDQQISMFATREDIEGIIKKEVDEREEKYKNSIRNRSFLKIGKNKRKK